jgi:hypothetical protein
MFDKEIVQMKKMSSVSVLATFAIMTALTLAGCGGDGDGGGAAVGGGGTTAITPTFIVKDTSGAAVPGATVYAIPAADVAAISAQPITKGADGNYTAAAQKVDEPLEDLINGNFTPTGGGVATYKSAVTDASGKAVFTDLAAGATDMYFMYVKPAGTDTGHLPGGSTCRTAVSGASLNNKETAIKISTTPTAAATYIGSSLCITCHASYATEKQTLHKLGIMVPKSPSALQDVAKFQGATDDTNFYAGLDKFESGTTVYFYNTSGPTTGSFKTLKTPPTAAQLGAGKVYFTLVLSKVGADYQVQFNNIANPGSANDGMVHKVALTYGGGLHKQRYLAKIGNSLYVIPLQYNPQGSDSSAAADRTVWIEYNTVSNGWWDQATNTFTLPTTAKKYKSFDVFCAGCHFTGYSVTENASGEFVSSAAFDYQGETHPVAGTKMEMNIGCESCHGPGSEHLAAGGLGKAIVTPLNITPEREVTICASCHTRGASKGTAGTHGSVEALLDVNLKQMKPGTSRATFLANFTSQHDASLADGMWADLKHSKKHHQQATDFIQTKKYRNGSNLMSCASSSCHDVHAPGTDRHQLSGASNNSLCLACHTTIAITTHMTTKAGYDMGPNAKCIECHATKTAKSGSGSPFPGMTGISGTAYYQGDITSHLLDVPKKTSISPTNTMPIPYTNGCGGCHIATGL